MEMSSSMGQAIRLLTERLQTWSGAWLVGGSCGLLLQGIELEADPRDLDIYANSPMVYRIHEQLIDLSVDQQAFNETDRYRSILSHYEAAGVPIELVGDFEVRQEGSLYRVDVDRLLPFAQAVQIEGRNLAIMPLAHEFIFNLLRDRADRYTLIAKKMLERREAHQLVLREILQWTTLAPQHQARLDQLMV